MRALEDLTYERPKDFIMKHKLPLEIPLISFRSEASIASGVLATMTHIAHAEVPWLPLKDTEAEETNVYIQSRRQVPVVMPLLSSAMAIWCPPPLAQVWRKKPWRSLVTCRDTEVPGSVVVRPDRKLDHAWMVYSSKKRNPREADASEMCGLY